MYKNIKYIFVFMILFTFFKVNVNAESGGKCYYVIPSIKLWAEYHDNNKKKKKEINTNVITIAIMQGSQGEDKSTLYYYAYGDYNVNQNLQWNPIQNRNDFQIRHLIGSTYYFVKHEIELKDQLPALDMDKKVWNYCPELLNVLPSGENVKLSFNDSPDPSSDFSFRKTHNSYQEKKSWWEGNDKDNIQGGGKPEGATNEFIQGLEEGLKENVKGADLSQCASKANWIDEPEAEIPEGKHYCLYAGEGGYKDQGCYTVQIVYTDESDSQKFSVDYKLKVDEEANHIPYTDEGKYIHNDLDNTIKSSGCPYTLFVGPTSDGDVYNAIGFSSKASSHLFDDTFGGAFSYQTMARVKRAPDANLNVSIINGKKIKKFESCSEVLGDDLIKILQTLINIIRIVIPIILNIFGVIDFGKAVFANNEEEMKKAQSVFIKRLIIGAAIFLIAPVLKVILKLAHRIWPVVDATLCGILGK